MTKPTPRLGKVQLQIMQILWERNRATAREITDELAKGNPPPAHSTVQTLLRKMEAKNAITHEIEERKFIFRPLYREAEITTNATRDLLTRVFQGSVFGLVSHLIKHEAIDPDEMQQIRDLIEKEAKL